MLRLVQIAAPLCLVLCAGAGTFSDEEASLKRAVVRHHAELAEANYQDALAGARKLADAVESLVARPSASALERARQAWIEARRPYVQSEAFRFYEGPIDEVEGFINAWPIDEGLIDYVVEDPEMIRALARHIAAELRRQGFHDVQVYADAFASLNGHPAQRFIDPSVDLASNIRADWIVPLNSQSAMRSWLGR